MFEERPFDAIAFISGRSFEKKGDAPVVGSGLLTCNFVLARRNCPYIF